MKIFYILLAILALYILGTIIRMKYTLSNAHLPEIVQEDKTFVNQENIRTLRYIAAGDSTALGEGATSVDKTYAYRLAQELSIKDKVEYRNIAVRGARTQDVIDFQLQKIIEYNPDIITISIGANDVNHLNSSKKTVENFKNIIQTLQEKTQAQIYLTNIPILDRARLLPYPYRKYLSYQTKKINPQINALGNDRVHIVDIYNFGWDKYPDINVTFANDGFHPSDEGYKNWTNAFLSRIQ